MLYYIYGSWTGTASLTILFRGCKTWELLSAVHIFNVVATRPELLSARVCQMLAFFLYRIERPCETSAGSGQKVSVQGCCADVLAGLFWCLPPRSGLLATEGLFVVELSLYHISLVCPGVFRWFPLASDAGMNDLLECVASWKHTLPLLLLEVVFLLQAMEDLKASVFTYSTILSSAFSVRPINHWFPLGKHCGLPSSGFDIFQPLRVGCRIPGSLADFIQSLVNSNHFVWETRHQLLDDCPYLVTFLQYFMSWENYSSA